VIKEEKEMQDVEPEIKVKEKNLAKTLNIIMKNGEKIDVETVVKVSE
jgi:hypothetical protein